MNNYMNEIRAEAINKKIKKMKEDEYEHSSDKQRHFDSEDSFSHHDNSRSN